MDSVPQVVANATGSAPKRPKKLVKGSAAAKRWMAYVRSGKKGTKKSAKTPARKPLVKKSGKASSKKSGKASSKKSGKASSPRPGSRVTKS